MKTSLELTSIDSEFNNDLFREWSTSNTNTFFAHFYLVIEDKSSDNSGVFHLYIASPSGLNELNDDITDPLVFDRNLFVYREFSWKQIESDINNIIDKCNSVSWNVSLERLQRYFKWEDEELYDAALNN